MPSNVTLKCLSKKKRLCRTRIPECVSAYDWSFILSPQESLRNAIKLCHRTRTSRTVCLTSVAQTGRLWHFARQLRVMQLCVPKPGCQLTGGTRPSAVSVYSLRCVWANVVVTGVCVSVCAQVLFLPSCVMVAYPRLLKSSLKEVPTTEFYYLKSRAFEYMFLFFCSSIKLGIFYSCVYYSLLHSL